MHSFRLALPFLFLAAPCIAQTADEIMARVAANQDRATAERTRYTYVQHVDASSRRGSKVLCHEVTDSRVTPTGTGSSRQLLTLSGSVWRDGHYETYDHLRADRASQGNRNEDTNKNEDKNDNRDEMDVDLVEHLRKNLTDTESKDGFAAGLFPLTTKALTGYDYTLAKREPKNGHDTWHIRFKPKDTSDYDWKGDAWIDTTAYEPVLVQTRLSRGVPFLVKTMLGTNVPGLGFAATYEPQPDGTWFPVTFGTEFNLRVLFFFHRTIVMNARNGQFQKTHSESRILDSSPAD